MIQLINTSSGSSASVTIDPYDTDNQQSGYEAVTEGTHNISAGKYKVEVENDGSVGITVNGSTLPAGEKVTYQAFSNPATQKIDYTPAVEIVVPAGGTANYETISPSA